MKAIDITTCLEEYYKSSRYVVPNIYLFDHPYKETDLLVVKDNGYTYDIEIKVSRSDFKADFKKVDKHSILKHGYYKMKKGGLRVVNGKRKRLKAGDKVPSERPNRFYFAVPEGLVKKNEVPKYAGLLYISADGSVEKIKEAPALHKKKIDVEPRLCRKFYFYWLNCKNKL